MLDKRILPESFDFGVPSVDIIDASRALGLDKKAMVKRASAFDDILDSLEVKPNRTYLHVITTGAMEKYGANRNCFVAGTPVVTVTGMKPIEDVKVGDLVQTETGEYKPVVATMARQYTGNLVTVKVLGVPEPVTMTDNHPVLSVPWRKFEYLYARAYRSKYISMLQMEQEADALSRRSDRFTPAGALEKRDYVIIPERVYNKSIKDIPLSATFINGTFTATTELEYTTLYAYCMGLWLAEGCIRTYPKIEGKYKQSAATSPYGKAQAIWTLHPEKDAASIQTLEKLAEQCGRALSIRPNRTAVNCFIGSSWLAIRYTDLLGRGAGYKRIHPAIFNMSRDWKLAFLAGYIDGDGCISRSAKDINTITISTASLSLATDLQALLYTLGITAACNKACNKYSNGCFGAESHDIYQLAVSASQTRELLTYCLRCHYTDTARTQAGGNKTRLINRRAYCRITATSTRYQSMPVLVYNLEVADNHTYCVPFVVHNCDAFNETACEHTCPHPEQGAPKTVKLGGGLKEYHDKSYMDKKAGVYQEHNTKDTAPSGEIIAAKYNDDMHRGELLIAVDTEKWAPRLQKKASGENIYLSMGCVVPHDWCSVCHRMAKTAKEHCDHFRYMRTATLDDGTQVCVINDRPSFYDISGVDVPADRIAYVLRKVASGDMAKTASAEALATLGARSPMLFTKAARLLSKLAEMEKQIEVMVEGGKDKDNDDVFQDDEDKEKDFILRVENYPADEVIDLSSRKGILLSPGMLFKLMGRECPDDGDRKTLEECDDDSCGDCSAMMRELDDDEGRNSMLLDGTFDQRMPVDLSLANILESFIPDFGMTSPAVGSRSIHIVIMGGKPKERQRKEASYRHEAETALRRMYARYFLSFAERNDDATCKNALRKIARYGK